MWDHGPQKFQLLMLELKHIVAKHFLRLPYPSNKHVEIEQHDFQSMVENGPVLVSY